MNTTKTFAITCVCGYLIDFVIPEEEIGMSIKYECPVCGRRGHTPGVSPEGIAMATWQFNKDFGESGFEQAMVEPEELPEIEPEPTWWSLLVAWWRLVRE